MKSYKLAFYLFLMLGIVLLYSCNKEEDHNPILTNNGYLQSDIRTIDGNDTLFDYITNYEDQMQQRLIFSGLTSTDKYNVWFTKLSELINSNYLTIDQLDFVTNLRSFLTIELFEIGDENIGLLDNFIDSLWDIGSSHFEDFELYYIFMELDNSMLFGLWDDYDNTIQALAGPGPYASSDRCGCRTNSSWMCGRIKRVEGGNLWGGIELDWGDCMDTLCVGTWYGCGGLWLSRCNGLCLH